MGAMDVLKVILYLIGFCSLLFLTYVTTRYVGRKQNNAMKSKNISIVETVMLGADKRLHLVRAGSGYILIASTSKSVEFLTAVDMEPADGQEQAEDNNETAFDFRELFEKYKGFYKQKKEKLLNNQKYDTPQDMADEHAFRSNLGKLRTIVNKNQNQVRENGDDATNEK